MSAFSNAIAIPVVIIALGLIVYIHELGHFLAAKRLGVRVLTFSFGFGKRLFGFRNGRFSTGKLPDPDAPGTDYRISLLPLGGYVKMAGEESTAPHTGSPDEFSSHSRWQRFIIVVMGPVMNILLAVTLLTVLYRFHYEEPPYETQEARIGSVVADSAAAKAGLAPGDLLTQVGELHNPKWEDVEIKTAMSPGQPIPVEVSRGGELRSVTITPKAEGRERFGEAGWEPCVRPQIDEVQAGLPASKAGIKTGDQILALDGRPIPCWQMLPSVLQAGSGKPVAVTVKRGSGTLTLSMSPFLDDMGGQKRWRIGVMLQQSVVRKLTWSKAFKTAIDDNIRDCQTTFAAVGKILTRQMSARSLNGPIGMVQMSEQAYRLGFSDLIRVAALISLSLGIFNLLPIPILDGGVIFMLLIETIMGRDLSLAVKERVVQVGLALLLLLTVFVVYNDLMKNFKPN